MTQKYFFTFLLILGFLGSGFGKTTCPAPGTLTVSNISASSATIAWSSQGMETQWNILILPAGTPEPAPNATPTYFATVNPFIITGLTPCTTYKYYVQAVCSPGETSVWSQAMHFTTMGTPNCSFAVSINATQDIPTSSLYANVSAGTPPFTFQWSLNGTIIPGATSQNLAINGQGGTYQVTVTDSASLTTTATITIQGISIIANNDSMTVYPTSNSTVNTQSVLSNDSLNTFPIYNYSSVILTPVNVPSGFTINPDGTISVLPGTAAGTYALTYQICATQSPTTCSTATATVTVTNEGFLLKAFADTNNNGTQDVGETNFNLGNFTYQINNNGITNTVVSSNGTYYIQESNAANTYDLSFLVDSDYSSYHIVSPSSYNDISFVPGSGVMVINFPVTQLPYSDAIVNILPYGAPPRPGFTYTNLVTYKNAGNQPIVSGTVTFNNSNTVTITNVSQTGTVPTATGFTYDFTNLLPNETRYLYVTMQVPTIPTVALGNLITNTAAITIPVSDATPSNNSSNLTQTIVGSYDPNDKTESHGEKIVHSSFGSNDYLTYTIQFENTGTYSAENVKISDILDAKLDETSVKMTNASHPYILSRAGNTLTWNLNGIDLLPSGKGHVTFEIKPKPGYAIGDIIPNTASIYFDFNPAIVTNTFQTEFVSTMSVSEFNNTEFVAYPNPTKGLITIASKNTSDIQTISITDVLGKTVLKQNFASTNATIDVAHLTSGIYFLTVVSKQQKSIVKIVKQ